VGGRGIGSNDEAHGQIAVTDATGDTNEHGQKVLLAKLSHHGAGDGNLQPAPGGEGPRANEVAAVALGTEMIGEGGGDLLGDFWGAAEAAGQRVRVGSAAQLIGKCRPLGVYESLLVRGDVR